EAVWQPSVRAIASHYDLVPSGVVWQIVPRGTAGPLLPGISLVTRGVEGSRDAVVAGEIAPEYVAGFLARARHLVARRDYARAVAEYDRALAFDPGNVAIARERNLVAALH
ncbi:MAG TPA: hypothetical protein VNL91_09955, partial [Thermoanaerobaculia bacterium]|nr:hypothetical protein [Thermoanaerobaculia bacterium]